MENILIQAIEKANSTNKFVADTVNRSYNMAIDHAISSVSIEMGKDRLIDETLIKIISKLQSLKS